MSKKKEEEPQMLRLRVLVTSPMPHPRMAGTKFEWPDGEEARGWIARGTARIIGDDPAEIEPEKPKVARKAIATKKTAKKKRTSRRRKASPAAPVVVTVERAVPEEPANIPAATEPETKKES